MAAQDMSISRSGVQKGVLSYLHYNPAIHDHEKLFEIMINMPINEQGQPICKHSNAEFRDQSLDIQDVRGREDQFSLDREGVCWRQWTTSIDCTNLSLEELRRRGNGWIRDHYVKEMEAYIKYELEMQGSQSVDFVKIFDYRVRTSKTMLDFQSQTVDLYDGLVSLVPSTHPHVDQSFDGALGRLKIEFPEQAERLSQRRFRIINVWKPLSIVRNWPLTVCDSQTVSLEDLIESDLVRRKFVLETFYSKFNPRHQWYYLSDQKPEEVTFLKIFDSNVNVARFCIHASFEIPGANDEVRESLEVRALVFDPEES